MAFFSSTMAAMAKKNLTELLIDTLVVAGGPEFKISGASASTGSRKQSVAKKAFPGFPSATHKPPHL
jgi:hypothetical protein